MSPLLNATVRIAGSDQAIEVTKKTAHFKIMLPPGKYELDIACHGYEPLLKQIVITDANIISLKITLYEKNTTRASTEIYQGTIVQGESDKVVITDSTMHEPFHGVISTGIKGKVCFFGSRNKCLNLNF